MFESLVDSFLEWEIDQIILVQKVWVSNQSKAQNPNQISHSIKWFSFRFRPFEQYLEIISHVTTARFMHMYLFPFVLVFSLRYYVNIMIAAIISNMSINIFKWYVYQYPKHTPDSVSE